MTSSYNVSSTKYCYCTYHYMTQQISSVLQTFASINKPSFIILLTNYCENAFFYQINNVIKPYSRNKGYGESNYRWLNRLNTDKRLLHSYLKPVLK